MALQVIQPRRSSLADLMSVWNAYTGYKNMQTQRANVAARQGDTEEYARLMGLDSIFRDRTVKPWYTRLAEWVAEPEVGSDEWKKRMKEKHGVTVSEKPGEEAFKKSLEGMSREDWQKYLSMRPTGGGDNRGSIYDALYRETISPETDKDMKGERVATRVRAATPDVEPTSIPEKGFTRKEALKWMKKVQAEQKKFATQEQAALAEKMMDDALENQDPQDWRMLPGAGYKNKTANLYNMVMKKVREAKTPEEALSSLNEAYDWQEQMDAGAGRMGHLKADQAERLYLKKIKKYEDLIKKRGRGGLVLYDIRPGQNARRLTPAEVRQVLRKPGWNRWYQTAWQLKRHKAHILQNRKDTMKAIDVISRSWDPNQSAGAKQYLSNLTEGSGVNINVPNRVEQVVPNYTGMPRGGTQFPYRKPQANTGERVVNGVRIYPR